MNVRMFIAIILASSSLCVTARVFDVSVWRGETTVVHISDFVSVGPSPSGFEVKEGVALPVRYLEQPNGMKYAFVADRVVWGSGDVGPRFVSIKVPADAKAGVYACGDMNIRVVDRVLPPPSEWKYYLDLWQHPWAVSRYFGVEPFSPAHYRRLAPILRELASAGQKALTVTILDRPWNHQCYDGYGTMIRHIRSADGKWRFDYRIFDEYVKFGRSCGIGPHIACYTMCPWDYEVTWETDEGVVQKVRAVPGSKEFVDYWGDFLEDFSAHLKTMGWFDDAFVAMDERSPEDVMNIATFVKERAPGLRISLAGNRLPSDFKGVCIDNYCSFLGFITDQLLAEAKERRDNGKITTFYVCCGPNLPNTFSCSQTEEAFWLGVYPACCGLDGFLRWAWNSWPKDPVVDSSYGGPWMDWKAGDTFLVYPNGEPSVRYLELRNGIVAAEKLRILREQGGMDGELNSLVEKFDRKAAMEGKCDFGKIRAEVLKFVNR